MEVTGRIKEIFDTVTFDSGFKKREFVVTTKEQYPQDIKLECIKDRCDLLDNLKVGDEVAAHFNLRGNEFKGRYYVNLQAWKIEKSAEGAPSPEEPPFMDAGEEDFFAEDDSSSGKDDLPF